MINTHTWYTAKVFSLPGTDLRNYAKQLTPTQPFDISDRSLTTPVGKTLLPVYAQPYVQLIITILLDSAMGL